MESVKNYNLRQDREYLEYCNNCISNGIEPTKQSRYFAKISVNYGFIVETQCNGIVWKKRKKDFIQ